MKIWGHRGSHGSGGPLENTVAAFERAIAEGADGIEFDVHLSADGVPMVFHDEALDRLTDDADPMRLEAMSAADLINCRLCADARMPTLADVFDHFLGRIPLNVEVKTPAAVDATARLLAGRSTEGVMLSSFFATAVRAAADRLPAVPRGYIVEPLASPRGWAPAFAPFAHLARIRATHWHPDHRLVHRALVTALHRQGIAVNVWTVNDPQVARRMVRCGVDGIMTDRPGWMRRALARLS